MAHCWRFDTEVLWLKEHAGAGKLGRIVRTKSYGVHANWGPGGWFTQKPYAGGGVLADLEAILGGDVVRGAWEFSAGGGYSSGEPVYLSFDVGGGCCREDVSVWQYDGADWAEYDAWEAEYQAQMAQEANETLEDREPELWDARAATDPYWPPQEVDDTEQVEPEIVHWPDAAQAEGVI